MSIYRILNLYSIIPMLNDMTQGKVLPCLLRFCLPMLGAQLLQLLLVTVDALVVGRFIGEDALGAVNLSHSLLFSVWGIFWGLTGGLGVVVGQYYGAKNESMLRRAATHGIILIMSLALLLTAVSIPTLHRILVMMGTPAALIDGCLEYSYIMCGELFIAEFYEIQLALLRALGDSKTQLLLSAAGVLVNLSLDLLFVLGFHWGIAGTAYATVLSHVAQTSICAAILWRSYPILHFSRPDWHVNWRMIRHILVQGAPMAMNYLIIGVGIIAVQTAINGCGAEAVNAIALGNRVLSYGWMPFNVMGAAVATFVSQNYGAGKFDRIFECIRTCLATQFIMWLITLSLVFPFGKYLAMCFIKNGEGSTILPMAVFFLRAEMLSFPFFIFLLTFRHTMQGLGHASVSLMGGIVQMIIRCVSSFALAALFGYAGVCFVEMVAWAGESTVTGTALWLWKRKYDRGQIAAFDSNKL